MVQWVKMRKGKFSLHLDETTTHLLFTDEEFKSKNKHHRSKVTFPFTCNLSNIYFTLHASCFMLLFLFLVQKLIVFIILSQRSREKKQDEACKKDSHCELELVHQILPRQQETRNE